MRNDDRTLIQNLAAQGVPMRDIQRALENRRTRQAVTAADLRETRKQRVGVLL